MKAGPIEVGRLLQNRHRFCVPIYQRHYVWTREKQWEPFWNDIRTKAIERLKGRERRFSHFMGAVVLEARGGYSARQVPSFQVVDGQQRLTTFQVFLAAAREYAKSKGFESTAERILTYLLNDKPHLMEEPDVEIYKVWPTQFDRPLFIDILTLDRAGLKRKLPKHFYAGTEKVYPYKSVPSLLAAYAYFFDRIRHSVETDDLDDEFQEAAEEADNGVANGLPRELKLDAIWQSLVEEFKVVEINLEEGDDAQVIFETLNERGEPLLAADLIRNNIFQRTESRDKNAEQLFDRYWKPFEDPFWTVLEKQGRYKKPRIEFFLSNFISGQIAGEINLSKLFSEYKAFIKTRQYPTVAAELQELGRFGVIYRELIDRTADTPLVRFSKRLQPWDVTTVYPLVLRLMADSMSDEEKDACLDMLLAFIVRRAICGLTTKNYNKYFLSLVAGLDKEGWSAGNLAALLFASNADSARFPRDEEFEQRWMAVPAYTLLQSLKARAVLEEVEIAKRTRFHEVMALAPSLTVEHILPREWQENWPLADGELVTSDEKFQAMFSSTEDDSRVGAIVRRDRLKNTFGNLTLLTQPLNSSISNAPFDKKKAALEEHSLLVLNREVTQQEDWNEERILARGKALFQIAKGLWPLPRVPANAA